MFDTLAILLCLNSCLDTTTLNQLKTIVAAMLAMTGRVTMLGISRWAGEGGSYRTVQRFFNTPNCMGKRSLVSDPPLFFG